MAIPVDIFAARAQVRLEVNDDSRDSDLERYIADAAAWVEKRTGHILVARDVTEAFRGFGAVKLRAWPIKPTAVPGVAYADADGTPIALTGARLDLSGRPARVLPAGGPFWPFRSTEQLFTVTIRAGYEDEDPVPGDLRRAMLVLIAGYDADREGGEVWAAAEKSARSLCSDYRLRRL